MICAIEAMPSMLTAARKRVAVQPQTRERERAAGAAPLHHDALAAHVRLRADPGQQRAEVEHAGIAVAQARCEHRDAQLVHAVLHERIELRARRRGDCHSA